MADIELIYKIDGALADAKVFVSELIAGTWTKVDDGTWTTGADGSFSATGLTAGAKHIALFVDPTETKATRVREFTP